MLTDPYERATPEKSSKIQNLVPSTKKAKRTLWRNSNYFLETKTVPSTNLSQTTILTGKKTTTATKKATELKESQKLFIYPVQHVGRQTIPRKIATLEPMQPRCRLPGTEARKDTIRSTKEPIKMTRTKLLKLQPNV